MRDHRRRRGRHGQRDRRGQVRRGSPGYGPADPGARVAGTGVGGAGRERVRPGRAGGGVRSPAGPSTVRQLRGGGVGHVPKRPLYGAGHQGTPRIPVGAVPDRAGVLGEGRPVPRAPGRAHRTDVGGGQGLGARPADRRSRGVGTEAGLGDRSRTAGAPERHARPPTRAGRPRPRCGRYGTEALARPRPRRDLPRRLVGRRRRHVRRGHRLHGRGSTRVPRHRPSWPRRRDVPDGHLAGRAHAAPRRGYAEHADGAEQQRGVRLGERQPAAL